MRVHLTHYGVSIDAQGVPASPAATTERVSAVTVYGSLRDDTAVRLVLPDLPPLEPDEDTGGRGQIDTFTLGELRAWRAEVRGREAPITDAEEGVSQCASE